MHRVATQNVQKSFATVGVLFGQVVKALGSGSRIFEFMEISPQLYPQKGLHLPNLQGSIEFKNVFFKYPSRPKDPVLQNISRKIFSITYI